MFITKYGKKFLGLLAVLALIFVITSCGEGISDERKEVKEKVNEVLANILFNKPEETSTNLEFAIRENTLLPGDDLKAAVYGHKYGGTVEVKSSKPEVLNLKWIQANVRGEDMEFKRDNNGNIIYVLKDAEGKTYYIDPETNKRVDTAIKEGEPVPQVLGLVNNTIYKLVGAIKRPEYGTDNVNVKVTITVSLEYEDNGETKVYSNSKYINFTILAESTPVFNGTMAELKAEIMDNYNAAMEYPVNFNATVTAIHYREGQFQVADSTDGLFVFKSVPGLQIGDLVNVQGKVTQYYGFPQVGKDINVTVLGSSTETIIPTPITVEELASRVPNALTGEPYAGKYFVSEGYFKYYKDREGNANYHLVDAKGNDIQIYYKSHIVWEEENVLNNYLNKYVRMKYNVYTYRSGGKTWQVSFNLTPDSFVEIDAPIVTDAEKLQYAYNKLSTTMLEYLHTDVVTLPEGNPDFDATFAFNVKAGDVAKMSIADGKLTFKPVLSNLDAVLEVTITVGELTETFELPLVIKPVKISTVTEARAQKAGEVVITKGVVTAVIGNNAFIQDSEAGIYIYVGSSTNYVAKLVVGNEVAVIGTKDIYSNLHQVKTITSVEVLSTGHTVEPVVFNALVIADLVAQQGKVITINGLTIKTIPEIADKSYSVVLTDGVSNLEVRVDAFGADFALINELFKSLSVGDPVNLVNVPVGQFNANPQLMPSLISQIVLGEALSDAEKLAIALEDLTDDLGKKTDVFALPLVGSFGAEITWVVKEGTAVTIVDSAVTAVVRPEEEDVVVILTATISLGSAEPVTKEVVVTIVKKAEVEPILAYHFDFEPVHSTSYADATPFYKNRANKDSDFQLTLHRVAANKTGKVSDVTNSLVLSPRTDGSDGKSHAIFDFGADTIKKIEFECYFWDNGAEALLTMVELQVKVGEEWVTVMDLKDAIKGTLVINTLSIEGLSGSVFRLYAEGIASGNNNARFCVDNFKAYI